VVVVIKRGGDWDPHNPCTCDAITFGPAGQCGLHNRTKQVCARCVFRVSRMQILALHIILLNEMRYVSIRDLCCFYSVLGNSTACRMGAACAPQRQNLRPFACLLRCCARRAERTELLLPTTVLCQHGIAHLFAISASRSARTFVHFSRLPTLPELRPAPRLVQ
jgi:hypothetical protein